ncbi:unnamed protein product [Moneuplotes crassus]|uniref:Acid phosphatase n=1 Tax=Euplotes crassus TaxID=5936 RepID=A0AAD1XGF8_EUPCR|nr:unnamed protein product [Moneuplotes crassus]
MFISFIVSLVGILALSNAELLFVSEISRHGIRAPGIIYDLAKDPSENFQIPYKLSPSGQRQHYLIGAEIRRRYMENEPIISKKYNNTEVFFRSSNSRRTLESLESQLIGLYSPEDCYETLNDFQQNKAIPPFEFEGMDEIIEEEGSSALPSCHSLPPIFSRNRYYDFKLSMFTAICPVYKLINDDLKDSRKLKVIQQPYVEHLNKLLKPIINESLTPAEALTYCKYLMNARIHNIELVLNYTSEDNAQCLELIDTQLFYEVWGNNILWKLGSKRFLEHLLYSMEEILKGKSEERLHINVGHDMTLALVLNGLGYQIRTQPPFGSTLFFELRSKDDKSGYYVRTLYNDEPITFGQCEEQEGSLEGCSFEVFKKNIEDRMIKGNIYEICGDDEQLKKIEDIFSHYELLETSELEFLK